MYSRAEAKSSGNEVRLQVGEDLFRLLVQSSNDITTVTDEKCMQRFVAGPVERILGYDPRELVGTSGLDLVHPDDITAAEAAFRTCLNEPGVSKRLDYRYRHKDGHWVSLEVVGTNLLHDPLVRGIVMNVRDATERRRVEAALRESEERFRALAENSNDTIMRLDSNGRHLYVNPMVERETGIPPAQFIGKTHRELGFPAELCQLWEDAIESVFRTRAAQRIEFCLPRGIWIDWLLVPEFDPTGVVKAVIASARDITQIKKAQEQLAESEMRFRSIVESSPMGMHSYSLEEGGRLVFLGGNPAADRILGIDHQALVGKTIEDAFPPLAATEVPTRYREVASTGCSWTTSRVDYEDDRIRGAYEVYAFRTSPNKMAAVFLDVTQRIKAEEERKRLESQLAQAQKMESIGRLAGGVAHDFNNLLTGIIGSVSLALMDLAAQDPLHETLVDVQSAAENAAALTRQLLAFSRRQLVEPKVLDLNEVILHSQRMLRRLISEDVDMRLLPGKQLGCVRIDPGQVEQILVNLAVNARDSMPDGGRLTIETANVVLDTEYCARHAGTLPGEYVALVVSDNGTGMTEEIKAHLFEPFFSTKAKGKGTGLGLATVFGVVKQNHGGIEVYSELGMGSTFKVYLPRVDAKPEPPFRDAREEMPRGTETVFLVEDEEIVKSLAEKVLKRQGYAVSAFPNGDEALMALQKTVGPVHLLVTDVILPGMNGRVLAESVRARRPDIKVLFCSGYTENVIAHHGVLEEGIDFIGKPYSPLQLAKKVRAVLDGKQG